MDKEMVDRIQDSVYAGGMRGSKQDKGEWRELSTNEDCIPADCHIKRAKEVA